MSNSLNLLENRRLAYNAGRKYLLSQGYSLYTSQFWTNRGVIDLVMEDRKTGDFVFILIESLNKDNYAKRFRMKNVANVYLKSRNIFHNIQWYVHKYKKQDKKIRLDLVQVYIENHRVKLKHRKDITKISNLIIEKQLRN